MSYPLDFIDRLDLCNAAIAPGVRQHLRAQCEGVAPLSATGIPERVRELLALRRDAVNTLHGRVLAVEAVALWRAQQASAT